MYPEPIEHYYAPLSLTEAVALLAEHRGSAKVLAGGQSLVPLMKARDCAPQTLIDINRIDDLDDVTIDDGRLRIGAMVRHRKVADDALIRRHGQALADAAYNIGDVQVRNRGTLDRQPGAG